MPADALITSVYTRALKYAFLLLKYRQRSVFEMRQRLIRKKFSPETADAVVSFLTEKEFLNDEQFASVWTASGLSRSLGPRRISRELAVKGIPKEMIERCLHEAGSAAAQAQAAGNCARVRLKKMGDLEPHLRKARLAGYLIRRGYSPDVVWEVVGELVRDA